MKKLYPVFYIAKLIIKEKNGELTDSEHRILQQWLHANERNIRIYENLKNDQFLADKLDELNSFDTRKAYSKISGQIATEPKHRKVFMKIPNYVKYAAAVITLLVSTYFIMLHFTQNTDTRVVTHATIVPGNQKAVLITSDNQKITLDSITEEQIITTNNLQIKHENATLRYTGKQISGDTPAQIRRHTLITPRGGTYSLVLSDGTKVMLNADSRLEYPVNFSGNLREVNLEGEAFFSVTKLSDIPFVVNSAEVKVKVYGTAFNISAYRNDNLIETTLIKGVVGISVKKDTATMETKIKPGQQFYLSKTTGNNAIRKVDTNQYTAWTKGMFVFENKPIDDILKIMSRWYDFTYHFKNNALRKQRFTLSLHRKNSVSAVLNMIAMSSDLKFETKGKQIIVYSE